MPNQTIQTINDVNRFSPAEELTTANQNSGALFGIILGTGDSISNVDYLYSGALYDAVKNMSFILTSK